MTTARTLLQERLISIVKRFPGRRILVVGDAIADQFVYGVISRVSREAPVFILRHEHTETVPGGAANCAMNLVSLGAGVSLIGVVGEDVAGRTLVERLETAGVDCTALLTSKKLQTTTKVRILAGQLHSTRQQVIRLDYEGAPLNSDFHEPLSKSILEEAQTSDAVIISDYSYGVASQQVAGIVRDTATSKRIPVLVDSRSRLAEFKGFTSATPNEDEVEQLLGKQPAEVSDLESAGEEMRERLGYRALLITRGSLGMVLFQDAAAPVQIDAVGAREPVDVTGAGDTVIAAYTLALASGASFPDAARLANYAGGLVVMKRGTASVTGEELQNSVLHSEST
ncbi:MAG: bifunctional hydroxymethylpyrimidine kinase/phosphomethylpyrimidine kinase [Pyrinomonadaceae bacterium]|nr:bifunctional hydroxymethylpyrimidine kinase/phosphomethylpyrimidine kinase [Pyrinomonadaceae bacterium]